MRPLVIGSLVGSLVSLVTMLLFGLVHRYVYGPALSQFGDAAFFTDMAGSGIFWLVVLRVFAAWLGSSVAVRLSDEPHTTWAGPVTVILCALTTTLILGMSQPIWSLILSLVLVPLVGLVVGRAHVGLPLIPGLDQLRARSNDPD